MIVSIKDIKKKTIPSHIAIIMDGNGRWAEKQGKDRIFGHYQGVESVREAIKACAEIGVKYLTVYAFSTENWTRDPAEVNALMSLFVDSCINEVDNLHKNNVRVKAIGNLKMLDENCQLQLQKMIEKTQENTSLTFVIAISYGARWEISRAARLIAEEVKNNRLNINDITENTFDKFMQTRQLDIPDPDLLIRTSNEYRLSNYLLWQLAYSELYFTEVLWPDFSKEDLIKAIHNFQCRDRRFGKTNKQSNKINY